MNFEPDYSVSGKPKNDDLIFFIEDKALFLTSDGRIPAFKEILGLKSDEMILLGRLDFEDSATETDRSPENGEKDPFVWLFYLDKEKDDEFRELESRGFRTVNLRNFCAESDPAVMKAVFRAFHVKQWKDRYKFCPSCGQELGASDTELALSCAGCQSVFYPVISPAVIVTVLKGKELLLCKAKHRIGEWRSLVAGYVEAGESLEEAVVREVEEETGLKIDSLKYLSSQPWPFSGSLMCGFVASYKSGEIRVQEDELEEAAWFPLDNLPAFPPAPSIAHSMIVRVRDEISGPLPDLTKAKDQDLPWS